MTYADMSDYRTATPYLERSLANADPSDSHVRKAFALLIGCYVEDQDFESGWQAFQRAHELFPDDTELIFRSGILLHHFGRLEEAARAYQKVLTQNLDEKHFSSVDQGIMGYKARHNLALVYCDMNRFEDAAAEWQKSLDEAPDFVPAWTGLGDCLVRLQDYEGAEGVAKAMSQIEELKCDAELLRVSVLESQGDLAAMRRRYSELIAEYPTNENLHQSRCRFLFENTSSREAIAAITQLTELLPKDGAAWHNLGTLFAQTQCHHNAATSFERSLSVRPGSPDTLLQLGQAYESVGDLCKARDTYMLGVDLDPNVPVFFECLERLPVAIVRNA